jgi:phospholipid/cholesterol/gamma-HCH transport system ATP-binding protein
MMPPLKLELVGLVKAFHGREVLAGLDLGVAAGRSLVIIGGSGQGKSVTIKIAAGLMRPDAGAVLVDGVDVAALSGAAQRRRAAGFGFLFQGGALFDSLPVWRNVAFRLLNADRVPPKAARAAAVATLAKVGLAADTAELFPGDLSGGMQKRVALARAVIAQPEILFFDEPTTGLDPVSADVINELITQQVKELGCTAVTITHDLASARKIGDEIAMLHRGRIIWRGPAAEVDRSGDPVVEQFVAGRASGPFTARPSAEA